MFETNEKAIQYNTILALTIYVPHYIVRPCCILNKTPQNHSVFTTCMMKWKQVKDDYDFSLLFEISESLVSKLIILLKFVYYQFKKLIFGHVIMLSKNICLQES